MKKEDMKNTWHELVGNPLPIEPEGYSTIDDIVKKTGYSYVHLYRILSKAKKDGSIEIIRGRTKTGSVANFYKD